MFLFNCLNSVCETLAKITHRSDPKSAENLEICVAGCVHLSNIAMMYWPPSLSLLSRPSWES